MSELEQRFQEAAEAWEAHCAEHREASNPAVFVNHPTFEALVLLGSQTVPLVIARYREGSLFYGAVLRRLTGMAQFGDGVTGNLQATRRDWLAWWDRQHGVR